MSATIILGGIVVVVVGGIVWLAYRSGKRAERSAGLKKHVEVRDEQLKAANNAPRTREEIIEALRERGL